MEIKEEKKLERLEEVNYKELTWINLEKPTQEHMNFLGSRYPFHSLNLEDCLSKVQLTKIDAYEDHLFIVLHFPVMEIDSKNNKTIRSSQLSIFLGENYLVTVHQGELEPLLKIFQACKENEEKAQAFMNKGSVFLFYRILDSLVDYLFPLGDYILKELDSIEDKVFDEKIEAIKEVSRMRRNIADLRRIVYPLRRIIDELSLKTRKFSEYDLSNYFDDVKDHVEKIWEILEESKETVEIYKDTDFILSTERTNKILALLTIVFTLSIPASLIASFYGMNINLPGGIETGPYTFFGPYTTLIIISSISIAIALFMLWIFHRKAWI